VGSAALFGIDAWHRVPALPSPPGAVAAQPDTVVLVQRGLMGADALDGWFDELVSRHAPRLLRFQGVVSPEGETSRLCCVGVRSFATSHPESDHPNPSKVESRVLLTGWDLDAAALEESFRATLL
jgi:G3E family GTPase